MSAATLTKALEQLITAARKLGVDLELAQLEGRQLAAAVSESNRGAFVAWCEQLGLPANAEEYSFAAVKGRRFRSSPTPLATYAAAANTEAGQEYQQALVEIATCSAFLGEPNPLSLGAAQSAAAAQLMMPAAPTNLLADPTQPPEDFALQAPAVLADVLARLSLSQQSLLDLNRSPLTPGAIPGLGPNIAGQLNPSPETPGVDTETSKETEVKAEPELAKQLPEKSVEEWLAELDELVGLDTIKAEIRRQTAILRIDALRTEAGLRSPTITRHLIFTGNPGTGKTTVARMVAGIYKAIGLLSKGQLVEVDRSELVAGYLGQTAIKTAEVVTQAIGGVLFIDEAYSLAGDQYGEEAINTLVKEMEDNRDDLVVIVAGYTGPMAVFISENPGLNSRFRTELRFLDYTDEQLAAMFQQMVTKSDYDLGDGVLETFQGVLGTQVRDEFFGNGRYVRNVFEAAIGEHAWRMRDVAQPTLEQLRTLLPEDFKSADEQPVVEWTGLSEVSDNKEITDPADTSFPEVS